MAKEKKIYSCSECGFQTSKWLGKCPECGAWNSFEEEIEIKHTSKNIKSIDEIKIFTLDEIKITEDYRYKTEIKEFDRVLGGGIVKGQVILLTGNPGVGKSTLLLQILNEYSKYGEVLYISGEESIEQIKYRSERIGIKNKNLYIMAETEIETIYKYITEKKPKVVVIDSIQTLYSNEYDSIAGTVTQIRETTLKIIEIAKSKDVSFFLVGHITKDGKAAGPKLLEHMVDTYLSFEGEENYFYRMIRSLKNRFGATNELGIFSMTEEGIKEVENPSEFFLNEREERNIGSIVVPVQEGTKIFLVEIQTLVTNTVFGLPRRVVQGMDYNRLQIITAVIEKKLSLNISNQDIFVNIPGGLNIKETGIDLGVALSIISSFKNLGINKKTAAIGEIGLRGEIRKTSFLNKKLIELEKMGFEKIYLPNGNQKEVENKDYKMKFLYLKNLNELLERMS